MPREKTPFKDQEAFDRLLAWLNSDRDLAARKLIEIRKRLVMFLVRKCCPDAEELADETIDRLCHKVHEIDKFYIGDPIRYFFKVARNIHLEYIRRKPKPLLFPPPDPPEEKELKGNCMERCMNKLNPDSRELITQFSSSKITRKILTEELGIEITTLRMRAHRIRRKLQKCLKDCIEEGEPD